MTLGDLVQASNVVRAFRERYGSHDRGVQLAIVVGLPIVSLLWAFALTHLRYTYLLGIAASALFLWTVFVLESLEVGLVLVVVSAVILEAELGGTWNVYGFHVGATDATMFGVLLAYVARRTLRFTAHGATSTLRTWGNHREIPVLLMGFVFLFLLSSLSWSEPHQQSLERWWTLCLRPVLLFVLARAVVYDRDPEGLILALLAFAILVAANENMKIFLHIPLIPPRYQFGYAEKIADVPFRTKMEIATLTFPPILSWPAWAGGLVASLLSIPVMVSLLDHRLAIRMIGFVAAGSLSVPLLLYLDRSSWLGGLLVMAIVVGFAARAKNFKLLLVPVLLVVAAGLFAAQLFHTSAPVSDMLKQASETDRVPLWINTLYALPHMPLLSGIGFEFDAFERYLSMYGQLSYKCTECLVVGTYSQSHNSYLQLLVSVGVPASVLFLFLLVTVFRSGVQVLARLRFQDSSQQALLAVFAAWCGLCLMAFFNHHISYVPLSSMFWLCMGTIVGLAQKINDQELSSRDLSA